MPLRRRAQAKRDKKAAEAQAALHVVAQHTEAGRRAMTNGASPTWAPPQMWSQPAAAWPPPYVEQTTAGPPVAPGPQPEAPAGPPPAAAVDMPPPPLPAPPAPSATAELQAELLKVLDVVTRMCDHVIEYLEADRSERRMIFETLERVVNAIGQPVPVNGTARPPAPRVVGGSLPATPEKVIDVREPDTAVEVRCLFGDRWVDGFEICEVIKDNGADIRYRLRRRVDGVVLPELFDAADIRHVETFEQLRATPQQQRTWSPL
jgi:hypothetical protein